MVYAVMRMWNFFSSRGVFRTYLTNLVRDGLLPLLLIPGLLLGESTLRQAETASMTSADCKISEKSCRVWRYDAHHRINCRPGSIPAATIRPGVVWKDTDGNPINAHGGGVLHHQGVYYWYGMVLEGRTYVPACNASWGGTRVVANGVSCYRSVDLIHWQNLGIVLSAVPDQPDHDLHCDKVIERPKVIYHAKNRKFVMWMHVDSIDYKAAKSGVAIADSPAGPFQYLGSFRSNVGIWPTNVTDSDKKDRILARDFVGGQMARDMTLFVDDDGKAYQFYASEENTTMHVSLLSDDYLKPAGKFARVFVNRSMEAPAVFKRGGKYYLIASDCTGWKPNAARSAVADHPFGPWKELGNPCVGDASEITFDAQGTHIFRVPGKMDAFVFMADRWKQWNLADSRYVWLPMQFDAQGKPVIRWRDEWSPGLKNP